MTLSPFLSFPDPIVPRRGSVLYAVHSVYGHGRKDSVQRHAVTWLASTGCGTDSWPRHMAWFSRLTCCRGRGGEDEKTQRGGSDFSFSFNNPSSAVFIREVLVVADSVRRTSPVLTEHEVAVGSTPDLCKPQSRHLSHMSHQNDNCPEGRQLRSSLDHQSLSRPSHCPCPQNGRGLKINGSR